MTPDESIYNFNLTKEALQRKGIYVGDTDSGYVVVNSTDVVFKNGKGNVEFTNNESKSGIYIKDSNNRYRQVFMYKRDYHLIKYGKPRYHICKCSTIQDFINAGGFRDHYRYANTEIVMVSDMDDNGKDKEVSNLPLCAYCAKEMGSSYRKGMSLEDYVAILKEAGESDNEDDKREVDIFGYVKNWEKISEAKRELEDYTCEKCGFKPEHPLQRIYIHVHHKDGNKLNNKEDNLQCLCIHCHANVDNRHRSNFSKGSLANMLKEFEEQYNK